MHYLYKIVNLLNNKIYIGQSINPNNRWKDHQQDANGYKNGTRKDLTRILVIDRAIAKHGVENFEFEVITSCLTQEDANEIETLLVSQYDSHISNDKGYNVAYGGSNAPKTDEWKQKVSEHHQEYYKEHPELIQKMHDGFQKWHAENPDAMKGENCHLYGKRPSKSTIENLVKYVTTTPPRKGMKNSEEHIRKSSEANSGEKNCNFGKPRSEETRNKIGNGNRGKVRTQEMKDHTSKVKTGNSKSNSGSFKPGLVPWNKKTSPSKEDFEIYQKHLAGQPITAIASEYKKLWKTIKKAINRASGKT